ARLSQLLYPWRRGDEADFASQYGCFAHSDTIPYKGLDSGPLTEARVTTCCRCGGALFVGGRWGSADGEADGLKGSREFFTQCDVMLIQGGVDLRRSAPGAGGAGQQNEVGAKGFDRRRIDGIAT